MLLTCHAVVRMQESRVDSYAVLDTCRCLHEDFSCDAVSAVAAAVPTQPMLDAVLCCAAGLLTAGIQLYVVQPACVDTNATSSCQSSYCMP
jgi:hypothetical protein